MLRRKYLVAAAIAPWGLGARLEVIDVGRLILDVCGREVMLCLRTSIDLGGMANPRHVVETREAKRTRTRKQREGGRARERS